MDFLSKIFSGSVGSIIDSVGGVVDKFVTTDKDKMKLKIELEALLQQRLKELEETYRAELQLKERVMVAELRQSDLFTKRARPALIWSGLVFVCFNYCLVPLLQLAFSVPVEPFILPEAWWMAWGGAVSVYTVSRTVDKRGLGNKLTDAIVGKNTGFMDPDVKG